MRNRERALDLCKHQHLAVCAMTPWIDVADAESLPENRAVRGSADGTPVLLVRAGDRIFALANRCPHQGAPLDKGVVNVRGSPATVTCPAHGSMFDLGTGRVVRPPATKPVDAFETKVAGGRVFVRIQST